MEHEANRGGLIQLVFKEHAGFWDKNLDYADHVYRYDVVEPCEELWGTTKSFTIDKVDMLHDLALVVELDERVQDAHFTLFSATGDQLMHYKNLYMRDAPLGDNPYVIQLTAPFGLAEEPLITAFMVFNVDITFASKQNCQKTFDETQRMLRCSLMSQATLATFEERKILAANRHLNGKHWYKGIVTKTVRVSGDCVTIPLGDDFNKLLFTEIAVVCDVSANILEVSLVADGMVLFSEEQCYARLRAIGCLNRRPLPNEFVHPFSFQATRNRHTCILNSSMKKLIVRLSNAVEDKPIHVIGRYLMSVSPLATMSA